MIDDTGLRAWFIWFSSASATTASSSHVDRLHTQRSIRSLVGIFFDLLRSHSYHFFMFFFSF